MSIFPVCTRVLASCPRPLLSLHKEPFELTRKMANAANLPYKVGMFKAALVFNIISVNNEFIGVCSVAQKCKLSSFFSFFISQLILTWLSLVAKKLT